MNCQRAFKILEIDQTKQTSSIDAIRKQYKILALRWHPDKNKAPNAADKYREIKEAHDFLIEELDNSEGTNKGFAESSYTSVASSFFETLYNNEHFQRRIFHPLLMKVVNMCEEKALAFILRLDADRANKLLCMIETWKTTLHFSDEFFAKVREHIDGVHVRHILLNPNIDDLMRSNVYCLQEEGLFAPLWHSLLEYEEEGIIVHCLPELPGNMWIDEDGDDINNTLNVEVSETLENIWKTGFLEFSIGEEKKRVEMGNLRLQHFQIVELKGQGIPIPHTDNVFFDGDRGLVRVHLRLN